MKNSAASLFIVTCLVIGLVAGYYGGVLSTPKPVTSATTTGPSAQFANVAMIVKDGWLNGTDNQSHDAFAPTNIIAYVGQTLNITFVNFDMGNHSFYSPTLNVNVFVRAAPGPGLTTITHYQFKLTSAGVFRWWCAIPCDDWAMATDPKDGQYGMVGYMGGYVTVLAS